jgi:short-subunit dehydrogenase
MKKSILIIGAGQGLSLGVAEKFAKENFSISLISRSATNLEKIKKDLESKGIEVTYATADAGNTAQLDEAVKTLSDRVSGFDAVLYNAAVVKAKDIMEESVADLTHEFTINVGNAVQSLQAGYSGLKQKQGAFLLTGGGLGVNPMAAYGSLSIGKAGLRSLAYQLHDRLKDEGIYVGLLTVAGFINPESATHSPAVLAGLFWKLYTERTEVEIHQ